MKKNKRKSPGKVRVIVTFIFVFVFLLLGFSARWGSATWGKLSMDEMIFTLTQPLKGTGQGMIGHYIKQALIPAIVLTIIAIAIYIWAKKHRRARMSLNIMFLVSCLVVGCFGYQFLSKLDVVNYVLDQYVPSTFIKDHYANPATTPVTFPSKKRNLIYIYLESMEMTSSDKKHGGAFNQDVIPELTNLSLKNVNFSGSNTKLDGGYSLPGTTWTMGAMFGQTSGLPLKTDIGQNAMTTQKSFFPSITTLGNILQKNGYDQTLMIGSDASFSGRGTYFKDHGNYHIEDYNAAKREGEIPPNYKVFWGYEDEKLFKFSKEKLTRLANSSKPFNFTMLTVDTHFPNGYKCHLCQNKFKQQYLNVMACSSRQVTSFVSWIQKQPWYKNTTIIINGDHPTMSQTYDNLVPSSYTRKTYTCYINADAKRQTTGYRRFSTMDNFPTTLAALGCKIKGNRLGLGTNLFSNEKTLSEQYGYKKLTQELKRKSDYLNKLEKMTNANAAKEYYYRQAAHNHKDLLQVTKVDGNRVYVRITDFGVSKAVKTVYLRASNKKDISSYVQEPMEAVNKQEKIYEGSIDVSSLKSKKFYIEVSFNDPEGINWPLQRKYVTLN